MSFLFGNGGKRGNESDLDYNRRMAEHDRIWNAAIEEAAKIANNWNLYCEEEIRNLKK